ncbi:hypothetical protein RchiOBHm_Chr4g0389931 [Rosa chinensis]|uniref:DUF247 domain protein n=1 Tax=Rosa chinensis TaxID=74649 RepID=A0A2P6QQ45_ROSCH|nr:UPF0481 protein At3g47200 isoform X1 [Rosa chinensis]XP_040374900.1 UPF0481 protein At3g47200 isoform X1 [Rosa chinensis]PRQ36302.1 hypothetical protein RchiOBHm_Chr4g0389931 [Rosa chinensis]
MEDDKEINVEALENNISAKLHCDSPVSAKCCIFRVPQVIRRQNPKAYQPDVVTIGPFHDRGSKHFQPMENVKLWYLRNHLLRKNITLKTLIQGINIIEFEKHAREFYAEPLAHLNKNDFIEMMILDGLFIIELFRKLWLSEDISINDPIFNMDCMFQYLCHDILLLENQLPWFVLNSLYILTKETVDCSLKKLLLVIFYSEPQLGLNSNRFIDHNTIFLDTDFDDDPDHDDKILHILDLIRTSSVFKFKDDRFQQSFYGPNTQLKIHPTTTLSDVASDISDSIVNIELEDRVYNNFHPPSYGLKTQFMHPATTLSEAGVVFRMDSGDRKSIMDIEFEDGVFTIPPLVIGELTESLFRNLIAFEQCYHGCSHKITSYVVLMDNLIASQKDMNLLCEKNIITTNWRSAELDTYQFFNKLYKDTSLKEFLYDGLCYQVNEHYQVAQDKKLQRMRRELRTTAQLKRDYLTWNVTSTSLWKVTSLIAASVLLGVTILQTIYAMKQYYYSPR